MTLLEMAKSFPLDNRKDYSLVTVKIPNQLMHGLINVAKKEKVDISQLITAIVIKGVTD